MRVEILNQVFLEKILKQFGAILHLRVIDWTLRTHVEPLLLLPPQTPQLREWDFGRLEGTKIRLMQDIYPQQYTALKTNLARFHSHMFDAESVYQATQQIIQFVKGLKDSQAETVLIVSHGAILTASILSLLGFETAQLRHRGGLDNSSITILETQDFEHFTELAWNDRSYKLTEVETIAAS